ncbi:MAG TPA: glycine oxidase ThiO [Kiritimatiellia bacterium]|jgi:glycine oxidase
MERTVGIAGAGLIGRVLGLELARRGWRVTLFDADSDRGSKSCAWTGAGMLAPYCELETAEPEVAELGLRSGRLWPAFIASLARPVFFQQAGSLVVAHPSDRGELLRLRDALRARLPEREARAKEPDALKEVSGAELAALEPELAGRFPDGLFMAREGQLDNRELLTALGATILAGGIEWYTGTTVQRLEPGRLELSNGWKNFDWVVDCRGLGAKADIVNLRGVRGELIYVEAPDVHLNRPVRLMHPRYPLYIVPRPNNVFVIGATKIESEDMGPVSVRSALELLTAAYAVHPGFAEGRIVDLSVNCRPAFPDNKPRILAGDRHLAVNGLYRHGFLVAPALAAMAADVLEGRDAGDLAAHFVEGAKARLVV